jgi:hypothetical protein
VRRYVLEAHASIAGHADLIDAMDASEIGGCYSFHGSPLSINNVYEVDRRRHRAESKHVKRTAIREFGLQVRLPQVLIFNHLQNAGSLCDAGVTQLNSIGRKLGLRLLEKSPSA